MLALYTLLLPRSSELSPLPFLKTSSWPLCPLILTWLESPWTLYQCPQQLWWHAGAFIYLAACLPLLTVMAAVVSYLFLCLSSLSQWMAHSSKWVNEWTIIKQTNFFPGFISFTVSSLWQTMLCFASLTMFLLWWFSLLCFPLSAWRTVKQSPYSC